LTANLPPSGQPTSPPRYHRARIDLACLHKLHDLGCDAVVLPRICGVEDFRGLIIGAPHCFQEIKNVGGHQHFDFLWGPAQQDKWPSNAGFASEPAADAERLSRCSRRRARSSSPPAGLDLKARQRRP
jgi:hypothetical protein